jgi:hypothetical protein
MIASLFATSNALATVDLIAKGQISGMISDLSRETAAPLENGAPGNLFGGIGSGMSFAAAIRSSPCLIVAPTQSRTTPRSTKQCRISTASKRSN